MHHNDQSDSNFMLAILLVVFEQKTRILLVGCEIKLIYLKINKEQLSGNCTMRNMLDVIFENKSMELKSIS